jgi:hypothetical protein
MTKVLYEMDTQDAIWFQTGVASNMEREKVEVVEAVAGLA